jgi:Zn-finger nucleic acid-binding protein
LLRRQPRHTLRRKPVHAGLFSNPEKTLKCPNCDTDLTPAIRHGIKVNACPSCHGTWFSQQDFKNLEDEVFDLDEHAKGTLVFNSTPTTNKCPECNTFLKKFNYRLYDLEMELCVEGHGYWLGEGDDTRVLQLMKAEEKGIDRSMSAEEKWSSTVKHMHSRSFLNRIRDLLR